MLTRRQLGLSTFAVVDSQTPQPGNASPAGTIIDQNPIRRRGVRLRGLDRSRTSPGFTLFAPMNGTGTVYLIDLNGKVVHEWHMPYPPGQYGYLTEHGTLFYNGKIPNDTFLGRSPFKGGVALEADWNGHLLWEVRQPNHHHDARLLKNGNVLFLCATELPADIAAKIRGGRSGTEVNGKIWSDYLLEVSKDGRTIWEWRTWEQFDPAEYPIAFPENLRAEWTHGNAIVELPDGNLLVRSETYRRSSKSIGRAAASFGTWGRRLSRVSMRPPRCRTATFSYSTTAHTGSIRRFHFPG